MEAGGDEASGERKGSHPPSTKNTLREKGLPASSAGIGDGRVIKNDQEEWTRIKKTFALRVKSVLTAGAKCNHRGRALRPCGPVQGHGRSEREKDMERGLVLEEFSDFPVGGRPLHGDVMLLYTADGHCRAVDVGSQ